MINKIFIWFQSFSQVSNMKPLGMCEFVQAQLTEAFEQYSLPGNAYPVASATDSILSEHVFASPDELDILRKLCPEKSLPDPYVKCPMCYQHFRMLGDKYYPSVR